MAPITSVRRARSKMSRRSKERLRCVYVLLKKREFSLLSSNGLFLLLLLHPNPPRSRYVYVANTHARLTHRTIMLGRAFFWGLALLALLATLSAVFTSSSFDLASSAPGGEGRRRPCPPVAAMQTNERLGKIEV